MIILLLFAISLIVTSCNSGNPRVIFKTELGDFTAEIYLDKAPVTAQNFMSYVDNDRWGSATFYRVVTLDNQPDNDVKIQVIQGGLYDDNHRDSYPPIPHETTKETGILHKDGILSMARLEPGTASSEFFICIGDQPELDFGGRRNPDGQGFATFGKVISGMETAHKIQHQPADGQYLNPRIKILEIVRLR